MQAGKKSDADVATELKKVELSEELTPATKNSLGALVNGPLSTEQIYVLEAKSALLPPPAAELPTAPAPDAAAQQALLAKANDYAAKTYAALPDLTANRMTARFQDGVEAIPTTSGVNARIGRTDDPVFESTALYVRLINTHTDPVESQNGIEKHPATKDTTRWGANNMTINQAPPLALGTILQEASANGSPHWIRWETIDGKQTAVFAINVDKKKTHFAINYCCFPDTDTAGVLSFSKNSGPASTGGSTAKGNLQTVSEWKPFKAQIGYHGELFIDPDTGTVLRTITQADFKPTDFVHSEAIRTDYAPMPIGGKTLVVPVRTFTLAEVVPNGDSFAAKYAVRHSFITQDYKDYQPAGATASK
jgi:hypothetical protein